MKLIMTNSELEPFCALRTELTSGQILTNQHVHNTKKVLYQLGNIPMVACAPQCARKKSKFHMSMKLTVKHRLKKAG
jgi:hypothetical protein